MILHQTWPAGCLRIQLTGIIFVVSKQEDTNMHIPICNVPTLFVIYHALTGIQQINLYACLPIAGMERKDLMSYNTD